MFISKLEAARIQLDFAINHFFNNDHICAVTLAGAAEDILAGLLRARGEQSAFEFLHEWYEQTYRTTVSSKHFSRQIANPARNWLKHADDDSHTEYDVTEKDSVLMLMRAVPCYYRLAKKHSERMEQFHQYINANVKQINQLFS